MGFLFSWEALVRKLSSDAKSVEELSTMQGQGTEFDRRFQTIGILIAIVSLIFFPSVAQAETAVLDLETTARQLSSPEALANFMKHNFTYVSDRQLFGQDEYWQSPEEMLQKRRGDCEDYALFAQVVLGRNGHQAFILSVYWDRDAHTVAIFEKDGKWGILDLATLRYVDAATMADLAKSIRPDWHYLGMMRQEGRIGIISRKFKKG